MKKIRRLKWSLIRPNCVRMRFWSDPIALELFMIRLKCARTLYDQTQVRSNALLIRPNCARTLYDQTQVRSNSLWSDSSALEYVYDQTFQTKMTSDQTISRPWSDRSALELPKRPCNFGLGTHGCALDWVWSEVNLGLDLNLGNSMFFQTLFNNSLLSSLKWRWMKTRTQQDTLHVGCLSLSQPTAKRHSTEHFVGMHFVDSWGKSWERAKKQREKKTKWKDGKNWR